MLVARRGLGPTELALADPAFLAAVRWAVFAEKAYEPVPELSQAARAERPDHMTGPQFAAFNAARHSAREALATIRAALALDEEPGDG